jgi:seryl-tRNA synthetase
MLDLKFITENPDLVKKAMATRSGTYDVDAVLTLDSRRKEIIREVEALKAEKNKISAKVAELKRAKLPADDIIAQMKIDNERIKSLDDERTQVEADLRMALLSIPNIPDSSVPVGPDDSHNVEIRKFMEPTKFDFTPKAHWDIGKDLGLLDPDTAAKITGARFHVYRGLGARLERAVTNFMLDTHTANGFTEILPPFMVNRASMTGTGQLPKFEEDAYAVKNTDYFLVPTAEVPVTNMLRDDVVDADALPKYYCAYTACFRGEAGSAGRDTRGLIRQHQFNKVELVKFSMPETSFDELESLTNEAELVLQKLGIPYRVVCLCTGDTGFSSCKTYDIEVWMPSYGRYVEISSCSNFRDYQARRMNIKYRTKDGKTGFLHTLNGSGLAVGRTTAAILENFQNADGTVRVPDALVAYMGTDIIK